SVTETFANRLFSSSAAAEEELAELLAGAAAAAGRTALPARAAAPARAEPLRKPRREIFFIRSSLPSIQMANCDDACAASKLRRALWQHCTAAKSTCILKEKNMAKFIFVCVH